MTQDSTTTTPTASEWAAFFADHPAELERLAALDRAAGQAAPAQQPYGSRATSRAWARYFDEHPAHLALLAAQRPAAAPYPVESVLADGTKVLLW